MALETIVNPNKTVNVTSFFNLAPTTGTQIAGFAAYKSGSMITLGFYLTTAQAFAARTDISVQYSCPTELKPVIRQAGGDSADIVAGVSIDPETNKINFATAQAIESNVGTWVMITYICANQ